MPISTPSSLARYRPAILIATGAAAAYASWLLYTSFASSSTEGLHRSNAVRRSNQRTRGRYHNRVARIVDRLQSNEVPLGDLEFFGHAIPLDTRDILLAPALQMVAFELEPDVSPETLHTRILAFYDAFLDRVLDAYFHGRALTPIEVDAVSTVMDMALPHHNILLRALERHVQNIPPGDNDVMVPLDDLDSVTPTEAGDWDEEPENDAGPQTLQRTLYHIAEDRARHEGVVHRGITCNGCDVKPIRGVRWHCANCADFDLCSDCEATNSHVKTHIFYKIRVPAPNLSISKQEPLYPGRPHMMSLSIDSKIKKRLISETRMEAEEMEALWDQFTCLATTSWQTDPNGLAYALDRRAFNQAFVPRYSNFKTAPNLIYDRVFAYFDTDHNGLIGFEEFVKGIDGLHASDTHVKLRIVFNGYDVDRDGYISRKDVLRVFRAHYAIEREATRHYLAESADEMSVRGALEVIQSAHPLGSAFTQSAIEPGERNCALDSKGTDEEVEAARISPIAPSSNDTMDRGSIIANTHLHRDDEENTTTVTEAIRDRWARRQFYIDEEEGFVRPEGADDGPFTRSYDEQTDEYEGGDESPTIESERPRWSRSSSRVRFQDDVDVETRSNASTSSRPLGERWGGYEIPEPEKDLGKEVLYQITQQAFNELLDPLFKAGEDAAMDAFASREERRTRVPEIDKILETFNTQQEFFKKMLQLGVFGYANAVVESVCESNILEMFKDQDEPLHLDNLLAAFKICFEKAENTILPLVTLPDEEYQPDENNLWIMMLYRVQLWYELLFAIEILALEKGWLVPTTAMPWSTAKTPPEAQRNGSFMVTHDPTLPQFRPNSLQEWHATQQTTADPEAPATEKDSLVFGPFFVLPITIEKRADADDHKSASEASSPPYKLEQLGITLSGPYKPNHERRSECIMHILSIDSATYRLNDDTRLLNQHPSFDASASHLNDTFHQALVHYAYDVPDSHLRDVALARLEAADRELNKRKGSGLVSFEEFERAAREGRMRFLEAWMDWVSI